MEKAENILKFWQRRHTSGILPGLTADFKQLAAMRRFVPFLKDIKLNNTSLQAGDSRSAFKGRGVEFEEVRTYAYGDDVRDIDWRVTARKNQPFTKLYAEEKDREVYVWLDLSAAMRFGTKSELKSVAAAKIAALIGWYALANKDRFGTAVFDGEKTHIFAAERTEQNLRAILKQIEKISIRTLDQESPETQTEKSLQMLHKRLPRRAIAFIISGFADFENNFSREVSRMARQNEVYVVNVFDILEQMAPPPGEYMAQYGSTQQLILSTGENFSQYYENYFAQKRLKIKDFCAKFNCRYREVRTDLPIYRQLKPV